MLSRAKKIGIIFNKSSSSFLTRKRLRIIFSSFAMMSSETTLIMTRLSAGIWDQNNVDRGLMLNLELKRQERRRNLRYRSSVLCTNEASEVVSERPAREIKSKSVDEYAKDLEQWIKKMKCTGVTGIRLESFSDIKVGVNSDSVDPSSPSLEPYPNLWEESFKTKGYKDEHGRLKGKAVLEFDNGDSITGRYTLLKPNEPTHDS